MRVTRYEEATKSRFLIAKYALRTTKLHWHSRMPQCQDHSRSTARALRPE